MRPMQIDETNRVYRLSVFRTLLEALLHEVLIDKPGGLRNEYASLLISLLMVATEKFLKTKD